MTDFNSIEISPEIKKICNKHYALFRALERDKEVDEVDDNWEHGMKRCSNKDCKKPLLPATEKFFYKKAKSSDGLQSPCKACYNAKYK